MSADAAPDRLSLLADLAVRSAVAGELGREIEFHRTLASTQERALAITGQAIVVADHQTAGRGTRDRTWVSPPGMSLLASWAYARVPSVAVSLLAGVAIARALDALGHAGALVKWPNDVQLDGRKVAGALAHAVTTDGGRVVVGIGINVAQALADFPSELQGRATSLALRGRAVDRLALLVRVTRELDRAVADPAAALVEWRERSSVLGSHIVVERSGEPALRGIARELASDGALVLETDHGRERVLAGEVSLA